MAATWPRLSEDKIAAKLWLDDLAGLADVEAADAAFRVLRNGLRFAPSWAEFLETYHQQRARLADERRAVADRTQLGAWTPDRRAQGRSALFTALSPT